MHERAILRGLDKRGRRADAVRLEDLRHLGDRQPFRKRDVDHIHVAARDLVDHLERRHRAVEPVIAGLEMPSLSAQIERRAKRRHIADHAGRDEALPDGRAPGP